jgi:hypothetical protein
MEGFLSLIVFLIAIAFVVWLYILLPAGMAERRNRSQIIWVLISLVGSPILACLLLLALGNAD